MYLIEEENFGKIIALDKSINKHIDKIYVQCIH